MEEARCEQRWIKMWKLGDTLFSAAQLRSERQVEVPDEASDPEEL